MRFCREMQKWRTLLVVALTAQLWSEGARAAGWLIVSLQASSSSPLSLSRWDFLTVNPENRRRADTEKTADIIDVPLLPLRTKSIIHCICLSPSPCVCLSLSLFYFYSSTHTNSGRLSDLVQSCEGSAGFQTTCYQLLSSREYLMVSIRTELCVIMHKHKHSTTYSSVTALGLNTWLQGG